MYENKRVCTHCLFTFSFSMAVTVTMTMAMMVVTFTFLSHDGMGNKMKESISQQTSRGKALMVINDITSGKK